MSQELENNNDLLNFDWESSTEDFFGITPTGNPEPAKSQPNPKNDEDEDDDLEDEDKNKGKQKPKKKEEEEEEDDDFFEGASNPKGGNEEDDDADDDKGQQGQPSVYNDLYKDLKQVGIFKHVEIEDDEELDEERFIELQEQEYETEVSERLTNWATNELDEDAKAFIKFKRDGGRTEEFFEAYSKPTTLPQGDIEDEDYQDEVIRYQLNEEGWDKDEIEDRIAYLTESGKKEKIAKKYDEKVKEKINQEKQAILKQAEANKKRAKQQEEEFKEAIKETLDETNEINGFKITAQDKIKVFNFLTKKEHKISDNKSVTGFQKKLAETFQDSEKMILLAKLIESDFDMTSFEKQTITKKTKQVKSNLEQRKNLRPNNSGSSLGGSSLADLFN